MINSILRNHYLKYKNMSSTLSKIKFRRNITLTLVLISLIALIAYSALRPDPEDERISEIKNMILSSKPGQNSQADRAKFRNMINKLSPATRTKLIREVMKTRLEQMRQETANLSDKEKQEKVKQVVIKMRKRFAKMTPEQREKAQARMNSPEGKRMMNEALGFFYEEFTPQERQLMEPIVDEFSMQISQGQ